MANPNGNRIHGGIALPGPESEKAARSFLDITGGMGLGALLGGGAGGSMPLLPSVGTNPVLSGLAFAGTENPLATLMGGGGGGDPAALLASLMGGGMGAEMETPPASDPQAKIYEAAITALQDPKFAELFIRSYPSALQNIVKLLATVGVDGGNAVG